MIINWIGIILTTEKYIIFPGGFLESGKTIGKVIDNPRINEFKLLKPDIVFKTIDNVLIFDAQICLEKNMEKNFNEKRSKYRNLKFKLMNIFDIKKGNVIPVIFNTYGIIYKESKILLDKYQIKLDYNKLFKEILIQEVDMMIYYNNK